MGFARSQRFALFITQGQMCSEGNPETKRSVIVLFFYLVLAASLRVQFSLVYLFVQFVFSAAALHFLVR